MIDLAGSIGGVNSMMIIIISMLVYPFAEHSFVL